ncbi:CcdB family protein [Piscinibacter sp.]|uniref:CcdB family protein n=1 Tax=Piscinibacter sp. TaxID=1903157 RepID=UPI002CFE57A4|nr:CcdB family protein [Albitalea sp.]HUG23179.1 CcdB family protein [Albitalea sp.]
MARYDVYANPDNAERKQTPYFVDIQNDYIDTLSTRVVIPLRRESVFGPPARDLNPILVVSGENVVLDTAAMGAVPLSELRKRVASLKDAGAQIQEALDTLFGAY